MKNKKKFLNSFVLQQTKIKSLEKMLVINPTKCKEYQIQINECYALRDNIEKAILLVDDEVLQEILRQKYIFGKTLEEISLIINYSKRHTERLHIKALNRLQI